MLEYAEYILLFFIAFIGYSFGSIAGGYSFISIPALLFIGLDPLTALGTNLPAQILPGLVSIGNYWHHGKLHVNKIMYLAVFFAVGALLGAYIVVSLESFLLKALIAALLLLGVLLLLVKNKIDLAFLKKNCWLEAVFLFSVGVYKSVFGASAKTLTMMVLTVGRGMETVESSAAASALLSFAVWTGSAYFILEGVVSWPHYLALTSGGALGAVVGTELAVKRGGAFVEKVLILVALVGAVKVLFF
ncbi:sulfite exporter TauE/SafE family protein [archaeon]|nr:sulfite exporter TauE/SafE family protein [archaeon]